MSRSYIAPELAEMVERSLPPEEFDRRVRNISEEEMEANVELIRWFMRRYPTAKERLAYSRRMFEQWTRPAKIVKRT